MLFDDREQLVLSISEQSFVVFPFFFYFFSFLLGEKNKRIILMKPLSVINPTYSPLTAGQEAARASKCPWL